MDEIELKLHDMSSTLQPVDAYLQMVTRLLRHPIPDQRHRAHADGKRAE